MSTETLDFQTEVSELLHLMIHSLYSERDIFLRELISNAADAIDKLHFESLTHQDINQGNSDWKIKITADEDGKTLSIEDNGFGMSRQDLVDNLGTIARSGTREFLNALKESDQKNQPELIGQFGVGFYSSFMVADKVVVETRLAGESQGHRWTSQGDGQFTIDECPRDVFGTRVTLHIKDDADDFLKEWKIRQLVTTHSNFVAHPICMDITREEVERDDEGNPKEGAEKKEVTTEETLNDREALWRLDKKKITPEQYQDFYRQLSHNWDEPIETIHYKVEGTSEFTALLFLPKTPPFEMANPERRTTLHLYINRVFIMKDNPDLLPDYLRFVQGVVDSNDLPLNVSREILQNNKEVTIIRKSVSKKVLDALKKMMGDQRDQYQAFHTSFGRILREGIQGMDGNRDTIRDLLLFDSSQMEDGKLTSLQEYISRMPSEQSDIYFLSGESRHALQHSPHLESVKAKGFEVLFLTDPMDEWVLNQLPEIEDKKVKSITSGELNLNSDENSDDQKDDEQEPSSEELKNLIDHLKDELKDDVMDVRLSKRLTDSACCLVSADGQMSTHMEKMLKQYGHQVPENTKRVLELNPEHALVKTMDGLCQKDSKDPILGDYAGLLLDQALLTAGAPLKNPALFAKRMSQLLVLEAGQK